MSRIEFNTAFSKSKSRLFTTAHFCLLNQTHYCFAKTSSALSTSYPPSFLPVCIFLFLFCFAFPVLVGDVYLVLMLHWKAVWLPTWLLENWVLGIFWHVFVASDTDSFMANIVFSRAWLPHLWESILDPRENRTFAYISQQSWSAPLLGFSSKRTFCDVVIPLCHSWFYELWRNWALEWFLWGIPKTESLIF